MRGGAALGLMLAALAAGCAPPPPPGERLVRVCDQSGCRDQPASAQTFDPAEADRAMQRPQGPDTYRGRSLAVQREGAEAGDPRAAFHLGVRYREGQGVPRDPVEAARWFTLAAENGVPEAQYNLALMLFRGDGVPRQPYQALQWMRRAAENGVLPAQKAVGRLYMTGLEEMGQDLAEAQTWLSLAAGRGDAEARRWLAQVEPALGAQRQANQAFQQQLALQWAQTQALWASIAWATVLAPPAYYGRYGRAYW